MKSDKSPPTAAADIVSEPLLYPGRTGLKIAAYWDHRREGFERCPFVVMAPKYGETKKNNLQLAYLLAANGMNVVRFDHTSHVGESAGPRTGFTLTSGVGDIRGTLDYIERRFGVGSAVLVASSLSARTAVRAAAEDTRVSLLVCIVGVVNVRGTLQAIYQEDIVGNYLAGKRWGVTDSFFGHEADWDVFLEDAIARDLQDLPGTERDLASIRVPVYFFSGEDDAWVDFSEVTRAVGGTGRGHVALLPETKHEIRENQTRAGQAMRDIVATITGHAWGLEAAPQTVSAPEQRALLAQNRTERERLRQATTRGHTEQEFWSEYLNKYVLLEHVDDYGEYLDLVGELIGPIRPGEVVLDAGCGNGLVGAWLLRKAQSDASGLPALYVGLDLTVRGLGDAWYRHCGMLRDQRLAAGAAAPALEVAYARADFDRIEDGTLATMPRFANGSFDAICCSLVLSYLESPATLLREFQRLLRPGGRIVASSMKPHCDISTIYKDFVDSRSTSEAVLSARDLLSGVGQIKLKEEQGFYAFFSGDDLAGMLTGAGFKNPEVFFSFGNQAVVVRASL